MGSQGLEQWIKAELPGSDYRIDKIDTDMVLWSVMNLAGDYNLRHIHTSNARDTWSCVLYVSVPEEREGGEIRFFNPNLAHRCSIGTTLGRLGGPGMFRKIKPRTGDLIVFPGWLEHDVLPFEGEAPRVVVAANLGIHHLETVSQAQSHARRRLV